MKTKQKGQKEWKITLYTTKDGKCPVNDFLETLTERNYGEMLKKIEFLKTNAIKNKK